VTPTLFLRLDIFILFTLLRYPFGPLQLWYNAQFRRFACNNFFNFKCNLHLGVGTPEGMFANGYLIFYNNFTHYCGIKMQNVLFIFILFSAWDGTFYYPDYLIMLHGI
jgi:hypothetical protein